MARVRVVEARDARGHVIGRARVSAFPVTLGRAFDNDVIVDDEFVSPHHCRLVEDDVGQLWVEDTGSVNGLRRGVHGARESRILMHSGAAVVAGHTTIRVFDVDHVVPEAVSDRRPELPAVHNLVNPRVAIAATVACMAVYAVRGYLASTSRDAIEDVVPDALGMLLLTATWSGAWALVGRITHAGARFVAHLGWASAGAVILGIAAAFVSWCEFMLPSNALLSGALGLGSAVLFTLFLAGHLTLVSSLTPTQAIRRLAIGMGGAALVAVLLTYTSHDRFSSSADYPTTLVPVPTSLLAHESPDAFADEVMKLRDDVDELSKKREREPLVTNPMKGL